MRCNSHNFHQISDILRNNNFRIESIGDFGTYPYLVHNYRGKLGIVGNTTIGAANEYNREVFETWDANTFLEYCSIATPKNSEILTEIL